MTLKCFRCLRESEEGERRYVDIQEAEYIYDGKSLCTEHISTDRGLEH